MASVKFLTTCDRCRAKKIRCLKRYTADKACTNCTAREEPCHFSEMKQRDRRTYDATSSQPPSDHPFISPKKRKGEALNAAVETTTGDAPARLSDSLPAPTPQGTMLDPQDTSNPQITVESSRAMNTSPWQSNNVESGSFAFFNKDLLSILEERLESTRFATLLDTMEATSISRRGLSLEPLLTTPVSSLSTFLNEELPATQRSLYIQCFFDEVHPLYPFLHRRAFESVAKSTGLEQRLSSDHAWAAIYYTVLSLGMSYERTGSFAPFEGPSWTAFRRAMRLFPYLLIARPSLHVLQAMACMTLFTLNYSSWPLEGLLVTEAARLCVAQRVDAIDQFSTDPEGYSRIFWTIYCLERDYCFHCSQSMIISDENIRCPLPTPLEDEDLTIFMHLISVSRLASLAHGRLFTATALQKLRPQLLHDIDGIRESLESWCSSIPEHYRPGKPLRSRSIHRPGLLLAALQHHCWYHLLSIAVARLEAHLTVGRDATRHAQAKKTLIQHARGITNMTHHIPIDHSTPLNLLAGAPAIATYVLFDLVVRNLTDPKTVEIQALLEVLAGYWLRLAMVSDSDCIGKLLAQFASISRDLLASDINQSSAPYHPSGRTFNSSPHSDVQFGNNAKGSLNNSDIRPVPLHPEGDDLHTSAEAVEESNSMLTDPWMGIWDLGEDISWIDIVGTPRTR